MEKLSLKENMMAMRQYVGEYLYIDIVDTRTHKTIEYYAQLKSVYSMGIIININGEEITLPYICINQAIIDIKEEKYTISTLYSGNFKLSDDHSLLKLANDLDVAIAYYNVFGIEAATEYLKESYVKNMRLLESANCVLTAKGKKEEKSIVPEELALALIGHNFEFLITEHDTSWSAYHQVTDVDCHGIKLSTGHKIPFMDADLFINNISTTNLGSDPLYAIDENARKIMTVGSSNVYLAYLYQFGYETATDKLEKDYYINCHGLENYVSGPQNEKKLEPAMASRN